MRRRKDRWSWPYLRANREEKGRIDIVFANARHKPHGFARVHHHYQPYWGARGHFLQLREREAETREAFTHAASLAGDPALRKYLFKRFCDISGARSAGRWGKLEHTKKTFAISRRSAVENAVRGCRGRASLFVAGGMKSGNKTAN
jgi:hypothetical protein